MYYFEVKFISKIFSSYEKKVEFTFRNNSWFIFSLCLVIPMQFITKSGSKLIKNF